MRRLLIQRSGNPAARLLLGRVHDSSPTAPSKIALMKKWLESCTSRSLWHASCPPRQPTSHMYPTRVISVMPKDVTPKLVTLPVDSKGEYAALSYCWRGPQRHQTTRQNLADYQKALPFSNLPASIFDAISLTRQLDIRNA